MMRTLIVGLNDRGRERYEAAGSAAVASVDHSAPDAQFHDLADVPPSLFDAAIVCLTDSSKFAIAKSLLAQAKHVMIEAPVWCTPSRLRELGGLSRLNKVSLYTAHTLRFEPSIVALKQIIDEGKLGKIQLARFTAAIGADRAFKNPSTTNKGAGVLSAVGSELIDLAQFLFGNPKNPFELWNHNRFVNQACDHAIFGAPGEPVLAFETTFVSFKDIFTIDVQGENGSAHVNGLCRWGGSSLTHRKTASSNGRCEEETRSLENADPTPRLEFEHFQRLAKTGASNIGIDLITNAAIASLLREVGTGFEE